MKTDIFQCKDEMPPKDNSPDVVRAAQTMAESAKNTVPARIKYDHDVENVERPRFGHGY